MLKYACMGMLLDKTEGLNLFQSVKDTNFKYACKIISFLWKTISYSNLHEEWMSQSISCFM